MLHIKKYNSCQVISSDGAEVMVPGGWEEAMKWWNITCRERVDANTDGMVMAGYNR